MPGDALIATTVSQPMRSASVAVSPVRAHDLFVAAQLNDEDEYDWRDDAVQHRRIDERLVIGINADESSVLVR